MTDVLGLSREEASKLFSAFGLSPGAYPVYYPFTPTQFQNGEGVVTGAAGSTATFTRPLNNFPHMIYGIRIMAVWQLPAALTADIARAAEFVKKYTDSEFTVRMEVAQQSVFLEPMLLPLITGQEGIHWHTFANPYPVAGGNNLSIVMRRVTSYPIIVGEDPIVPTIYGGIIASQFRGDFQTVPPHRAGQY